MKTYYFKHTIIQGERFKDELKDFYNIDKHDEDYLSLTDWRNLIVKLAKWDINAGYKIISFKENRHRHKVFEYILKDPFDTHIYTLYVKEV